MGCVCVVVYRCVVAGVCLCGGAERESIKLDLLI